MKKKTLEAPSQTPLQQEQRELVKKFILEAVAEEIRSGNAQEVSMAQVAERAHVSLRTLYRYYPTKEDLMESFWNNYIGKTLSMNDAPVPLADFPDWVINLFNSLERNREIMRAMIFTGAGREARKLTMHRRKNLIVKSLEPITREMDPAYARRVHALVHTLMSVTAWQGMHDNWGLNAEDSGKAVAWAIDVILAAVRKNPKSMQEHEKRKEQA